MNTIACNCIYLLYFYKLLAQNIYREKELLVLDLIRIIRQSKTTCMNLVLAVDLMRHPDHDMPSLVKWQGGRPCGTDEDDDRSDNESNEKAGNDGCDNYSDDKWMHLNLERYPKSTLNMTSTS